MAWSANVSLKIQPFDGKLDFLPWLRKFELMISGSELKASELKRELLLALDQRVFEDLVALKVDEHDYDSITKFLGCRYSRHLSRAEAQKMLICRAQSLDETYQEYAVAIKKLFDAAFPGSPDDHVIPYFVKGLQNTEVRKAILKSNCNSLWDAVDIATEAYKIEECAKSNEHETLCSTIGRHKSSEESKIQQLEQKVQTLTMELASIRSKQLRECFRCHKLGHISRECTSQYNPQRGYRKSFYIRRGAPTVGVRYNGRTVNAMIDTGASVSMIRYDITTDDLNINNKRKTNVLMANGLSCETLGEIDITLEISDLFFTHKFLVSKNLVAPIILGADFLFNYCSFINFHSDQIVIEGRKIQLKTDTKIEANSINNYNINNLIESMISTCDLKCSVKNELRNMLISYEDIFSTEDFDVGKCSGWEHEIITGDVHPVKENYRRLPVHKINDLKSIIDKLLEKNIIRPSKSAWSSPVVIVNKKSGGIRLCIDYRSLNNLTVTDAYPIPRIDETLDRLHGVQWFSCFDFACGYWQIPIVEKDKAKTAFATPLGFYEFNVMPFGLKNAPATFQRAMESIFSAVNSNNILIYLDDIVIYSNTEEEHLNALNDIFKVIRGSGMKIKPQKCSIFKPEVKYLGYLVGRDGVKVDPEKSKVVRAWKKPANEKELLKFLGFCNYYRHFIKDYAELEKSLRKIRLDL
ncbi:Retrovirus-related Pol polyprotein [Thelohanellus kitauei]|uniref:Retrovirus-related Pol polyprotein n=1 Tax=Thelohanellus kitauei TaxID=669202 RepID=A0A0C2ITH5_THEKT|nr:Retrovirus-related Pol polyprotein [Thelohanellus kitauei]